MNNMCQLTFADLGNLNQTYITTQLILNSLDNNPDGTGICSEGVQWKTKLNASLTLNLGDCVKGVVTKKPAIAHVRLASNKLLKEDEHSHPFRGKLFNQAHNGKLVPKAKELLPEDTVDSLAFLHHLETVWESHKKLAFPDLLIKTMDEWEGKFALMYYVDKTKDYYIAKGRTANLFWTTVNGGLVVNTERKTLDMALTLLNQQYQLTHKKALEIAPIKSVEQESIFRYNPKTGELDKVGEIKEETPEVKTTTWINGKQVTQNESKRESAISRFQELMYKNYLSVLDANYLCHVVMGCSLVELDYANLVSFNEDVLAIIEAMSTDAKVAIWKSVANYGKRDDAYKAGLPFPWMFASLSKLEEVAKNLGVIK
jgi:predicted glutamine amidotransferase